ncbi:hypothetical protein QWJ06_02980 [Kocuria rhizophila]|uniref:Uncharacterized protein n=1 Tax=Kocuria rhizophila TaxID=72000 RepID=A0AAX2SFG2_KOCRH|nr:hypothetical protein [Kocuria rhizophila]MBO4145606.1 hypothetical protein [Kocuria rhizophila]MDN3225682.1 hypothetical protein [Kocuria rhizophila]QTK32534.1 hypothetical protein J5U48_05480 [Kocuria rhizophila]TFI02545.1 hypothetical protein E4P33_02775 [Kocuria rhizophila]TFI09451.1 hypothetical protein E4P34_03945 [Kocuria rhizophila]
MSTPPDKHDDESPQCPWASHPATGEHERLSPPAPMIELDTPPQENAVKPLGPRRLARLQREMAEHARQLQETPAQDGGEQVDDALLAKQRRLAELALRAAAANEQDRRDADRAAAAQATTPGETTPGGGTPGRGAAPAASEATGSEYFTITFPGAAQATAGGMDLGSRVADPASLPASAVHYGPVTTQIPAIPSPPPAGEPAADAQRASDGAAQSDHDHGTPAGRSGPEDELPGGDRGHGTEASGDEHAPAASSETTERAVDTPAPAGPVRAVDAEGLELLEPRAYTRGTAAPKVLITLLLVVLAALAVVLVMFIL